jgi:hypothetical protein
MTSHLLSLPISSEIRPTPAFSIAQEKDANTIEKLPTFSEVISSSASSTLPLGLKLKQSMITLDSDGKIESIMSLENEFTPSAPSFIAVVIKNPSYHQRIVLPTRLGKKLTASDIGKQFIRIDPIQFITPKTGKNCRDWTFVPVVGEWTHSIAIPIQVGNDFLVIKWGKASEQSRFSGKWLDAKWMEFNEFNRYIQTLSSCCAPAHKNSQNA